MATDHGGSRAICSPCCANSIPVMGTVYGAAQLPFLNRRLFPMAEAKAQDFIAPWHVPVAVEEVAETGQHFDLVADATVRAAVAKIAGFVICLDSRPVSTSSGEDTAACMSQDR